MRKLLSLPIDIFLLLIPLALCVTGVITIYTITYAEHQTSLAISQGVFIIIGLIAMTVLTFTDYRALGSMSWLIYVASFVMLVPLLPFLAPKLPFVLKIFGAYRWLNFGFFQLQPAELTKLLLAIVAARYLAGSIGRLTVKKILGYFLMMLLPVGLVLAQPDLGTAAVLLAVTFGVFLAAKPSYRVVGLITLALAVIVPLVFLHLKPYQVKRLETFVNPSSDPKGEGWNVLQAKIAVGSGSLTGRGFGQGSQTVLNFLPVAHADFIFAGFAEATGFIGSMILLVLYIFLIFRVVNVAKESADPFGQLLAIGIGSKLIFQTIVHIGMNIGLLPVTGIPLPFMSYGGTAIIVDLASLGILQSIYIRHKKVLFGE